MVHCTIIPKQLIGERGGRRKEEREGEVQCI